MTNSIKNKNLSRAFTLIELLIVISIIGILAGISVSGYVKARNRRVVKVQAEALKNIIAEAKSLAISPPTTVNGTTIGAVSKVEVRIYDFTGNPQTVGIYIMHSLAADLTDGTEYRKYSGFDNVRFPDGDTFRFNSQGQKDDCNTPPPLGTGDGANCSFTIQNISGTNQYTFDVNKFGFVTITPL